MSFSISNPLSAVGRILHTAEQKVVDTAKAVAGEAKDVFDSAVKTAKNDGYALYSLYHQLTDHVEVTNRKDIPPPPDSGEMKLATYNILLGGQNIDGIEAELKSLDPDVVCLQETSEGSARRLADSLGMNLAFSTGTGKAILSRWPITETENLKFDVPWSERFDAAEKSGSQEPLAGRSVLRASLQIGDRTVDVMDTHLTLKNTAGNARMLQALNDSVARQQAQGHPVVLAGDMNTNFGLAQPGTADPRGTVATPTDTAQELKDRYGIDPGNIGDPADQQAAQQLLSRMNGAWTAPDREVQLHGQRITPEQALAELQSGSIPEGSRRYHELLTVLDGVTHLGANKRFDNILATQDLHIRSTLVDQDTRASDHQPVMSVIDWR